MSTNKELTAFRMAPDVMAACRRIRAVDGIPVAVQIDFALREWLKRRGVILKTERKRPASRRRS